MNKSLPGRVRNAASVCFLLIATVSSAEDSASPVIIGKNLDIQSEILGETRPLIIAEPVSYQTSPDERYPVLYLLDGDVHFDYTTGLINFLSRNGLVPEMLVVAIPNTDRTRDLTPLSKNEDDISRFPTQGGAGNFLKFLSDELAPWVEKHYRTHPYKILVGHSFGGLFALHSLITRPDSFDAYIAISPSLQWNDQKLVSRAEIFFDANKALEKSIYMTAGNEGGPLLGGVRKLSGILDEKSPKGFRWDFNLMGEESHGSVPLRSTYQGLEFVFAGWSLKDPVAIFDIGGLSGIHEYFKKNGKRYRYDRETPPAVMRTLSFRLIGDKRLDEAAAVMADPASPRDPSLFDQLAAAHVKNGDADKGVRYYTRSLEINPGNDYAKRQLTMLGVDVTTLMPNVEVSQSVLESYIGHYALPQVLIKITLENGHLFADATGQPKARLYAMAQDKFYIPGSQFQLAFNIDENGKIPDVTVHFFGQEIIAKRLEQQPDAAQLP